MRNRGCVGALALSLGFSLVAPVAAAGGAAQTADDRPSLDSTAADRSGRESRLLARAGVPLHETVAPAPDGRFVLALQTRPRPVIWMLPRDGEPFAFREDWSAYLPRWADSGRRLGFISAGGPPRVWTVEVDSATGRAMAPPRLLIRTVVSTFDFAPDGATVALVPRASTAAGASEIVLVDWESRRSRRLVRERGLIYRLDWSPESDALYYGLAPTSEGADARHVIRRIPIAGGPPSTVREVGAYLGLSPDGRFVLHRGAAAGPPEDGAAATGAAESGAPEDDRTVWIRGIDGDTTAISLHLPEPATPVWSARPDALLQVRPGADGDEVWEIPIPARD